MSITINLNKGHSETLKFLSSLGEDKILELVDVLGSAIHPVLRVEDLRNLLRQKLDEDSSEKIAKEIIAILALTRDANVGLEDVFESLDAAVKSSPDWTDPEREDWLKTMSAFKSLLGHKSIAVVSKALDLTYDYSNIMESARILTDIRPVFDKDDSEDVLGAIISQTLRIHYVSDRAENNHSISIALDERDLRDLLLVCQRALKKSEVAKRMMESQFGVNTIVAGSGAKGDSDV